MVRINGKQRRVREWVPIAAAVLVILIVLGIIRLFTVPNIKFSKDTDLQINTVFDPYSLIEKVRGRNEVSDVHVDLKNLDMSKMGEYTIVYSLNDEIFEVDVEVVDKEAPTFDVIEGITDKGIKIDPTTLVKNLKDDTKTTISFKKNYNFKKEGTQTFVIVVKDAYKNKTEKEVSVTILPKDSEAPVIKGRETIDVPEGSEFNPLNGMEVTDNQMKDIKLNVVSNNVDTSKRGTYEVVYEAIDRSGNKATFKRKIKIVESKPIYGGDNVVYLTFDDGPSYITPKVLDVLDKYNVKATFFVVGFNSDYHHYIKEAYDKGHTIALHTYSHDYGIYSSKETYYADLKKISNLVEKLTGYKSPYIRFPGGSSNMISAGYKTGIMSTLTEDVHKKGYEYYDWNVGSSDADGLNVPVSTIIESSTCISGGTAMILFHDAIGKETTVEALPQIIEYYLNLGYTFKAIDENTSGFHHGVNN